MKNPLGQSKIALVLAVAGAVSVLSACGGGDDGVDVPVTDRFSPLPQAAADPVFASQYDEHLAAATRNADGDQSLLDTWRKYYCMYPENNQAQRQQVIADNARLPLTQIFDDVWYVGSRYVGQYLFKSNSAFLVLDSTNSTAEVQQFGEPALDSLGAGNSLPVKDLFLTHGHGDHDGGALEIKTKYGANVYLGSGDATLGAPNGKPYAPIFMDSSNPNPVPMTLGGRAVTALATPGHTPGSVSAVLAATDHGKAIKIMVVGGSAMPTTLSESKNYLDSVERTYSLAKAENVVGTIHPHPVFDGTQRNVVSINASGMPAANPFVVGSEKVLRATAILRECSAANATKVDTTAAVPVWRVSKLELPTGGPHLNDISARLSNPWGAVSGRSITFKGSVSGTSCTAVTNENGIARCTGVAGKFSAGDAITATYDGASSSGPVELPASQTAQISAL